MTQTTDKTSRKVWTKPFMLCFPHLFKPTSYEGGEPKYEISMCFDKDDPGLKELAKAYNLAGSEKFGDKWPQVKKAMAHPTFRTEENGKIDPDKNPEWKGKVVIKAKSADPPDVVIGRECLPATPADIRAGDICIATVQAFGHTKGSKGVAFALHNVMKIKDGIPLSSRRRAEEDFGAVDLSQYDFEDDENTTIKIDEEF